LTLQETYFILMSLILELKHNLEYPEILGDLSNIIDLDLKVISFDILSRISLTFSDFIFSQITMCG